MLKRIVEESNTRETVDGRSVPKAGMGNSAVHDCHSTGVGQGYNLINHSLVHPTDPKGGYAFGGCLNITSRLRVVRQSSRLLG